ncbi:Queuine tRNA-ribosyltransferase accessory subunit 2 [Apodemus speciosus]|uniref:Queuine tRNA-ribosyltransferase accessory subunit 2 n=1 Tax=Apodemus speciosus TaxID=105296 RepID=A0ABQ0FM52_APOSI
MMKLSLVKVVNGCRLGNIHNLGKAGDCTVDIPGCLLYTRTGSAPHLTHQTLRNVHGVPAMAQLTLSSLAEHHEVLAEYKKGVGSFIGSVSVWGFGGRVEMTVSKFMAIQEALQPDWIQCLSDGEASCAEATSVKRARKSVDRSLLFLDGCLRLQEESEIIPRLRMVLQKSVIIGVIEGGDVMEERLRSARETAKRPVGGFLLDGFQGSPAVTESRLHLLSSVTAELPEDKPRPVLDLGCRPASWEASDLPPASASESWDYRLICGVSRPDEVLECIERGVDLFESFFPYQVTERGCALTFTFDCQLNPEEKLLQQNGIQEEIKCLDQIKKTEATGCNQEMTSLEINLKEKKYQEDFGPLVSGCSCYCCQNHTRAYVHHLLVTNELLAGVLLMMHNFEHYFRFFCSIREALKNDTLAQLKDLIHRQMS